MKKKTLINSDQIGPPQYATIDLTISYDREIILTLYYQKAGRDSIRTILSEDEWTDFLHITMTRPIRDSSMKYLEITLKSPEVTWVRGAAIDDGECYSIHGIDVPISIADLVLHRAGIHKLDKNQLKKVIIDINKDNFDALKQLKEHGVINGKMDKRHP